MFVGVCFGVGFDDCFVFVVGGLDGFFFGL